VPDRVRVIRAGLLEEPFEVIHGWLCWTLVAVRDCQAASHAEAVCFPIMVIITAGCGHCPLKALLVATIDALLAQWAATLDGASLSLLGVSSLLPYVDQSMDTM
jgi:hypothetical protein